MAHPRLSGCCSARRADAEAGGDTVVEFQHSPISEKEVSERERDYAVHGKAVVWVLDAAAGATVSECTAAAFVHFSASWMHASFSSGAQVLVDFGDALMSVCPGSVRGGLCQARARLGRAEAVGALMGGGAAGLGALVTEREAASAERGPARRTLVWKQRGAGCGKTFESIRMLDSPEYAHKNAFLYFTKVHSAREVIFGELRRQAPGFSGLRMSPCADEHRANGGKAYRVPFLRAATGEQGVVYIGTIDSFTFGVCDLRPPASRDFFVEVARAVAGGSVRRDNQGRVLFGGGALCMRTLVVVDEAQDLAPEYAGALAAVMRETDADAVVIGDKLQSIWGVPNVFTFLESEGLPGVEVVADTGANVVRRFHSPAFAGFVNAVVPFARFGLPPVESGCPAQGCALCAEPEFREPVVKGAKLSEVAGMMRRIALERRYLPCDFLVIRAVLKMRKEMANLEVEINEMWLGLGGDAGYMRDAIIPAGAWGDAGERWADADHCWLHSSQDGRPCDLSLSEHATRILSIHSAKGLGAKVVVVVDPVETCLEAVAREGPGKLRFESFLHVALTRQKKLLILAYTTADKGETQIPGDDVWVRINEHDPDGARPMRAVPVLPLCKVGANSVPWRVQEDDAVKAGLALVTESMARRARNALAGYERDRQLVDSEHHDMRAVAFHFWTFFDLLRIPSGGKKQLFAEACKVAEIRRVIVCRWGGGDESYKTRRDAFMKGSGEFPVLVPSGGEKCGASNTRLVTTMKALVKGVVKKMQLAKKRLPVDLTALEMLCFLHIVEMGSWQNYSEFRVSMIYRVIREGWASPCSPGSAGPEGTEEPGKLRRFHEEARTAHRMVKWLGELGPLADIVHNHGVHCDLGNRTELRARTNFAMKCGEGVVVVHLAPTFSDLNASELAARIAFTEVCIANSDDEKSIDRYGGAFRRHFVLSIGMAEPVEVDLSDLDVPAAFGALCGAVELGWSAFRRDLVALRARGQRDFTEARKRIVGMVTKDPKFIYRDEWKDLVMNTVSLAGEGYDEEAIARETLGAGRRISSSK